jgi:hypothetical protein
MDSKIVSTIANEHITLQEQCHIKNSLVSMATRCVLDSPGFEPRLGTFSVSLQTGPEAQPASWKMGTGSLSSG